MTLMRLKLSLMHTDDVLLLLFVLLILLLVLLLLLSGEEEEEEVDVEAFLFLYGRFILASTNMT